MIRPALWLVVAAGLAACAPDSHGVDLPPGSNVTIHRAVPVSAEGAISVEADSWTYSIPLEGVMWLDSTNAWHDKGRPGCVPPEGTDQEITFGSVDVTINGTSWRPVIWVWCQ